MTQHNNRGRREQIIVRVNRDMQDIVPEFLQNSRADVQVLLQALDSGDYATIQIVGHGMKGTGGLGFDHLNELGRSLEQTVKAGEFAKLPQLVDELATYLDRVEPVYE